MSTTRRKHKHRPNPERDAKRRTRELSAVRFAATNGVNAAAEQYGVTGRTIRNWRAKHG